MKEGLRGIIHWVIGEESPTLKKLYWVGRKFFLLEDESLKLVSMFSLNFRMLWIKERKDELLRDKVDL